MKNKVKSITSTILLTATLACLLCGCTSSKGNKPWNDLGVTKREYESVYNYYKTGRWS